MPVYILDSYQKIRAKHNINMSSYMHFSLQTKVKYIKKTTEILKNEYNSDIPNTVEKLCKLPGVGPKMSHLCMQTAWGEVTGIGLCLQSFLH